MQAYQSARRASSSRPENVSCRDAGFATVHLTMQNGTARLLPMRSRPARRSCLAACPLDRRQPQTRPAAHRRGVHAAHPESTCRIRGSRTELVDHLPASDTVPSPLKFFGRIVGTPGELTYAKDIHRYYAGARGRVAARAVTGRLAPPKKAATSSRSRSPTKRRSRRSTRTETTLDALTDPRRPPSARRSSSSRRPSRSTTS